MRRSEEKLAGSRVIFPGKDENARHEVVVPHGRHAHQFVDDSIDFRAGGDGFDSNLVGMTACESLFRYNKLDHISTVRIIHLGTVERVPLLESKPRSLDVFLAEKTRAASIISLLDRVMPYDVGGTVEDTVKVEGPLVQRERTRINFSRGGSI